MNPILDEVAKTSIQLMLQEPFYGHFFTSLLKDISDKTESVSLSPTGLGTLKLIINEKYWQEQLTLADTEKSKQLRYGAIKHQLLHLVLKHIMRVPDFGNKKLFNIAADLATNQYIEKKQLTKDAITIEQFPQFELEHQQSLDYYYKHIQEQAEDIEKIINAPPTGEDDSNATSPNPFGNGSSNSDEQDEDKEEDENKDEEQEKEEEEEHEDHPDLNESQNKLLKLMRQDKHTQLDQHKNWDDIAALSSAERKLLDSMINEAIANTMQRVRGKQYGTLPGDLQTYLDELLESLKPNINWRRVLRLFAATSSRTYLKNTIQRASKRYGTTPGIKIKRRQKIQIIVDTSGSVDDEALKEFFSEMYHIWKNGADIHVVECDTDIQATYKYTGTPPKKVHGRGGTDFNAPLVYANEVYQPDAIIYFTDGEAPAPEVHTRAPILWLICEAGITEENWDFLPGRKVKMTRQLQG
jgi:predicted metal-dependent peptidase